MKKSKKAGRSGFPLVGSFVGRNSKREGKSSETEKGSIAEILNAARAGKSMRTRGHGVRTLDKKLAGF